MASGASVLQPFSTLELVKHDPTANAAERDWAATAPETDHTASISQTAYGTDAEVLHDCTFPEAIDDSADRVPEQAPLSEASRKIGVFQKPLNIAIGALLGLVVVLVIGLGLGLGLGLRQKTHSSPPTPNHTSIPTTSVSNPSNTTAASFQPSSSPFAKRKLLADTSLASVTTTNGDRHVFFQDQSGIIRETIYTAMATNWSPSTDAVVTNAKNYAPISAIYVPKNMTASGVEDEIHLFFITKNSSLGVQIYSTVLGWYWDRSLAYDGLSDLTAATGSRALSATLRINATLAKAHSATCNRPYNRLEARKPTSLNTSLPMSMQIATVPSIQTYLLYENTSGEMTWLLGSYNCSTLANNSSEPYKWQWQEILPGAVTFYQRSPGLGPLNSSIISLNNAQDIAISYLSGSPPDLVTLTHYNSTTIDGSGTDIFMTQDPRSIDFTQGYLNNGMSDWGSVYGFWVNGSNLVWMNLLSIRSPKPQSPFPFTRLANTSPENSNILYLYHQINETIIAEDLYDYTTGRWISSNISIEIVDTVTFKT